VKLSRLKHWNERRAEIAARYDSGLKQLPLELPVTAPGNTHVYHLYVIRTERRDALREHLTAAGVATVLNYPKALPFYPAYAYLGHQAGDFPVAHANQSRILSLPIYPEMSDAAIEYVAASVRKFYANF